MRTRLLFGAMALLLYPLIAWSQLDEDEGDRENYVLNPSGQTLVVTQPNDDEASLVRRAPDGTDSTIVSFGQSRSGGTVDGVGSNPHMNAGGVAAFQLCIDVGSDCDSASGDSSSGTNGIYRGTPGSVTEIAVTGDGVAGEVVCIIEPFPLINASNQVFWGATTEGGDGVENNCDEDGGGSGARKSIFRDTTLLLVADWQGATDSGDTVTAVAPFGTDTYDIVDAHLIAHGGDAVTSSGNALVTAWLDQDASGGGTKERHALLYVTSSTISLVAMDDDEGDAPGDSSPIGWLGKGVANASGLVFFKGEQENSSESPATMNLWTSGGGISELVATGDGLPIGPGTFEGFAPHQDLNNGGAAAFTAGLSVGAGCDDVQPTDGFSPGFNGSHPGNGCRGVYYSLDGSSIVEVARNTAARSASGVGTSTSPEGFEFAEIGSVAIIADNGTVFFIANNQNPDPECGLPDTGGDTVFGGNGNTGENASFSRNDVTGVFAVSQGFGPPIKLIAEGDVLPEGKVMRLFTPMPELRQHDSDDDFVIRAWFDTTGNCMSDTEEIILASAIPFAHPIIPTLGPWGLWLLIGILGIFGGARLLPRRN